MKYADYMLDDGGRSDDRAAVLVARYCPVAVKNAAAAPRVEQGAAVVNAYLLSERRERDGLVM